MASIGTAKQSSALQKSQQFVPAGGKSLLNQTQFVLPID